MMSGRQLHGLVVRDCNGSEVGRIREVLAEPASGKITGFLVEGNGMFTRLYFLPLSQVLQLSLHGLMISGRKSLNKATRDLPGEAQLALRGRTLRDADGMPGIIADILVDNNLVCGWEISEGLLHDLRHRRRFLPREQAVDRGGAFIEIDQSLF